MTVGTPPDQRAGPRAASPAATADAAGPGALPAPRAPRASVGPDQLVAAGALVAVGLDLAVVEGLRSGGLVAVALLPVWWSATRRFHGARLVLGLGAAALVSGLWLAAWRTADHVVEPFLVRSSALLLVGGLCATGLVLWARTVLTPRVAASALAVGVLLHLAVDQPNPVNPWKHGYGFTVAVVGLALLLGPRPRAREVVLLGALAAVSAVSDSRSLFAIALLSAVLLVWQLRPTASGRRSSRLAAVAFLGAIAGCIYLAGTALLVEGYLGEEAQQRSLEQLDASGSVLLGGRPEWGAITALARHEPAGFGLGVQANLEDVMVAKAGMARLNYDPDNGYVENYMFGREIKLHAVVADLWVAHGLPGLALGLTLAAVLAWSVITSVARREASGLVLFLFSLTAWNLLFSPIVTSMPVLVLTLGLALRERDGRRPDPVTAAEPQGTPSAAAPGATR